MAGKQQDTLSKEQKYGLIFNDKLKILIFNQLPNGPITSHDLSTFLMDNLQPEETQDIDINHLITPMKELGLVETYSLNGVEGEDDTEYVMLKKDITIIRAPNSKIFNNANSGEIEKSLSTPYIRTVVGFFRKYKFSREDSIDLAHILSDPLYYEIISLLREEYLLKNDLYLKTPLSTLKNDEEREKIITFLVDNKIIVIINKDDPESDKIDEWVFPLSEIKISVFFPEYLVDVIRKLWSEKKISQTVAVQHLKFLREEYIGTITPQYKKTIIMNIQTKFESIKKNITIGDYSNAINQLEHLATEYNNLGASESTKLINEAAKGIRKGGEIFVSKNWEELKNKISTLLEKLVNHD